MECAGNDGDEGNGAPSLHYGCWRHFAPRRRDHRTPRRRPGALASECILGEAPLQRGGSPIDVYSFGMVCYAMWVGHHPYETPPRHAAALRRDHAARAVADDDCSTTDSSDDGDDSGEPDTEAEAAVSSDLPGTPFKIMLRVSNGERPALPRSMPPPLRALVAACWAHDPANRPSIAAAIGELDALRNE